MSRSSEKLAALAAACLRYAIDADQTIGCVKEILAPPPEGPYQSHTVYQAHREIRNIRQLSEFLPSRVVSLMARLG